MPVMTSPNPKGSFLQALLAVLWGFLGVRRRSDFQRDTAQLRPVHLLVVGVVVTLVFVLGLMGLVHWVTR
jgi:Protein of unknown function (DUF2970)